MRTSAPPLLPIFRSKLQAGLLGATLLDPDKARSLTELAARLGADVATVQREASRLERAGILKSQRLGNTRLVSADTSSVVFRPLAELVLKTFGPERVVREELEGIDGIEEVLIFGSWAARYQGVEGPPPGDLDVLVIGRPDRDELYEATRRMERRLAREVNATVRSRSAWQAARDGFVRQVRSSPSVPVVLAEADHP